MYLAGRGRLDLLRQIRSGKRLYAAVLVGASADAAAVVCMEL